LTNYYQSLYLIMQRLQNPHTTNAQEQGWHWDKKQKNAFHALKKSLTERHTWDTQFNMQKVLKTDASFRSRCMLVPDRRCNRDS
jgi:hypothetical protein